MKVHLRITNRGRETRYGIHTHRIQALDDKCVWACVCHCTSMHVREEDLSLNCFWIMNHLAVNYSRWLFPGILIFRCDRHGDGDKKQPLQWERGVQGRGQKSKFPTQRVRLDSSEDTGDTSIWLIQKPSTADWSTTSTTDETLALMKAR